MGDISEMILEGALCKRCGALMEDLIVVGSNVLAEPPGFPRLCEDCSKEVSYEYGGCRPNLRRS